MSGAYCLWYCYCWRDPIAAADSITDERAQRISTAHERGQHDHSEKEAPTT